MSKKTIYVTKSLNRLFRYSDKISHIKTSKNFSDNLDGIQCKLTPDIDQNQKSFKCFITFFDNLKNNVENKFINYNSRVRSETS